MSTDPTQTVEIIRADGGSSGWQPIIGPETVSLIEHFRQHARIQEESLERLQKESVRILTRCVDPHDSRASNTGLVIGHVQSGKTMSFTTVTAMAKDNGFGLVIIVTGTSVNLFEQSRDRLFGDLRLQTRRDRKWQHFSNPQVAQRDRMNRILEDLRDPETPPSERQTVLITVMKNHNRLKHLIALLRQLNLQDVSALIVDDEADQAGLNTQVRKNGFSPTYSQLLEIKDAIPRHTFLQYTATPQAPLLINIIDVLSPEFAELLTPGPAYVGGQEFFDGSRRYLRTIPSSEVPSRTNVLHEPPQSLLDALRMFFVGVVCGKISNDPGNRSMLVHPSRETGEHGKYFNWVKTICRNWHDVLALPDSDVDKTDLLADFKRAYDDLTDTVGSDMPLWGEVAPRLRREIRLTDIVEVNAARGRTPQIEWHQSYAHLLVGGQAMDRGFTVEGLTVTYMPRGVGVGNADTVQQRARFFGYKRPYLGYCRCYLESDVADAYIAYVDHEEDIRNRLRDWRDRNLPLSQWKRAFFLDSGLRPTRANVLDLDYIQDAISDRWFWLKGPFDSEAALAHNRLVVDRFLGRLPMQEMAENRTRTPAQQHLVASNVPIGVVYDELLTALRVTSPDDAQHYVGALLQICYHLEKTPSAVSNVYRISPNEQRERGLNDDDRIENVFMGANPPTASGQASVYPGDRAIRGDGLSIQLHRLNLTKAGRTVVTDVPVVAVWIPSEMAREWLSQRPSRAVN